ncbi:uncharacterized protein LOC135030608 [Pseudophryne corroboree]|uniref:uncharacterized protein LOC135030608 n=1 Tax=Pseudophryne corroboree TaxID=495146 RepID=UPI0030820E5B
MYQERNPGSQNTGSDESAKSPLAGSVAGCTHHRFYSHSVGLVDTHEWETPVAQLGQDIALSVQVSGEDTTVTWEVDGKPLPDRCQLVNDNTTLIIPNAQWEDRGRNFSVRITNPVSVETREHLLQITGPVVVSNITCNSTLLGQDIALSVQVSGEDSTVTWEVDGKPLPDRYRLVNDNTTLIIPNAQWEDRGRNFSVRITNPVSVETREHLLQITDPGRSHLGVIFAIVACVIVVAVAVGIYCICNKKRGTKHREKNGSTQNGSLAQRVPYTRASDIELAEGEGGAC